MKTFNCKKAGSRLLRMIIRSLFLLFITLCIGEISYRWQLVDFYKMELHALNPQLPTQNKADFLFFGDSFTASPQNFVEQLSQAFNDFHFVNAAIPGTGIKEMEFIFRQRLKRFPAKHIVIQVYPANDLFDLRHPINWKTQSIQRNVYWWLCDRFYLLRYLNYRSGQLYHHAKGELSSAVNHKQEGPFSIAHYSSREKNTIHAHPQLLHNSLFLEGEQVNHFELWLATLKTCIAQLDKQTMVYLLILPHCGQLSKEHAAQFQQLGATIHREWYTESNYPFVDRLKDEVKTYSNVQVLDPLVFMRAATKSGSQLYYHNDIHLNDTGQKWMANYLKQQLFN
jgi:hypothetical protein